MLKPDKFYQTREGDECIFLMRFPRDEGFPWIATLKDRDNGELYQQWYDDQGRWSHGQECACDLVEMDTQPIKYAEASAAA